MDAGLVSERRDGRHRLYKLEPVGLEEVADWVKGYEQFWLQKLNALGDYMDRKHKRQWEETFNWKRFIPTRFELVWQALTDAEALMDLARPSQTWF